ncbi:hypothetical protein Mgra_00005757 [Meloidogyne graminicola]|uniref:Copper transport protein n=1 Tax=Meloidogyne graminicola TaxID=189291 RepID=A0A8S9ZNJ2_9BILA|nr:hypothetical protein Mgra_00005757 [Meloidogyne graminicola]
MDHSHHHDHHQPSLFNDSSTILTNTENSSIIPEVHEHPIEEHHNMKMYFHGGFEEIVLFDFWRINSFFGLFNSFVLIFFMGAAYEGLKWFRVYFQLWTCERSKTSSDCLTLSSISRRIEGKNFNGTEDHSLIKNNNKTLPNSSGCSENCGNLNSEVYAPTVVISAPQVCTSNMQLNRWTLWMLTFNKFCTFFWIMMYVNRNFSPSTCQYIETGIYAFQLVLAYWLMLIAMTFNVYLTFAVILGAAFGHWLFANIKCSPPRRCFCQSCGNGGPTSNNNPENIDNFASDLCH